MVACESCSKPGDSSTVATPKVDFAPGVIVSGLARSPSGTVGHRLAQLLDPGAVGHNLGLPHLQYARAACAGSGNVGFVIPAAGTITDENPSACVLSSIGLNQRDMREHIFVSSAVARKHLSSNPESSSASWTYSS